MTPGRCLVVLATFSLLPFGGAVCEDVTQTCATPSWLPCPMRVAACHVAEYLTWRPAPAGLLQRTAALFTKASPPASASLGDRLSPSSVSRPAAGGGGHPLSSSRSRPAARGGGQPLSSGIETAAQVRVVAAAPALAKEGQTWPDSVEVTSQPPFLLGPAAGGDCDPGFSYWRTSPCPMCQSVMQVCLEDAAVATRSAPAGAAETQKSKCCDCAEASDGCAEAGDGCDEASDGCAGTPCHEDAATA